MLLLADRLFVTPNPGKSSVYLNEGHTEEDDHLVCQKDRLNSAAVFTSGCHQIFMGCTC